MKRGIYLSVYSPTYPQTTCKIDDARLGCSIDGYNEHRIESHNGAHVDYHSAIATVLLGHVLQCTQAGIDDAALERDVCIRNILSALDSPYQVH